MSYMEANYQFQQVQPKIAHIGLGAFSRAHMAWACHELLQAQMGDWGICAISLRGNIKIMEQLEQQNYRYLLAIQDAQSSKVSEVGSIVRGVDAMRDGVAAVVAELAQAAIVSMTVTEKGYYAQAATHQLDEQHPDIQYDLIHLPDIGIVPRTMLGFLALGLAHRQKNAKAGLALMSCDNIAHNSRVLQCVLRRFMELLEQKHSPFSGLVHWMEKNCCFPCTMVDRITPAITGQAQEQISQLAGKYDRIALSTEKFTQWVIEDSFPAGRPCWEQASGVIIVRNEEEVSLYEEMKLRMLNGSHSFLAYCGYLAGKEYVYECMQEDILQQACYSFIIEEQLPSLRLSANAKMGLDLPGYAKELMERYSNTNIRHRCYQIAMDGSLKVPQRWLDGYRVASSDKGTSWRFMPFALAAWLRYVSGKNFDSSIIEVQDPNAEILQQLVTKAPRGKEAIALFSFAPCFGNLANDKALIQKVQQYYQMMSEQGLLLSLKSLL